MPVRRSARLALAVSLTSFAVACSSGTEPTSLDATSLVSEMSTSSTQTQTLAASVGGVTPTLPTPSAASCTYTASSQSFVCPSVTQNGMTLSMSYFLYDAAGHTLSVMNPGTVDAIRTVMDMNGTTTAMGLSGSITMTRHSDQTMSGLISGNRVINGTASGTMNGTVTVGTQPVLMNSTEADTTTNLVPPAPGSSVHYPTSGTQITNQTGTSTVGGSSLPLAIRTVMTFHSDGTATVVLTTFGMTRTCTFNFASPTLAPSCTP